MTPSRYAVAADGSRYLVAGKRLTFRGGVYTTSDQEEINFLTNHKDFGIRFHSPEVEYDAEKAKAEEAKRAKLAETKTSAKVTDKKPTSKKN